MTETLLPLIVIVFTFAVGAASGEVNATNGSIGGTVPQLVSPGKYFAIATTDAVDRTPESLGALLAARAHATEVELAASGTVQASLTPLNLSE